MASFYIENPPLEGEIYINGQEAHHIAHVHRAQCGEILQLFDVNSVQYTAEIIKIAKKKITLKVISENKYISKFPIHFRLIQSLVKSKKWDIILQKSMELGLENLTPMLSQRVAAGVNTAGREERWHKVLLAAAKQSERPHLVNIEKTESFDNIIQKIDHPLLIAHTGAKLPSMQSVLRMQKNISQLSIMIGPEGGFSDKEIEKAKENNAVLFSLGNYVLRAETAAMAIIANVNFYFGVSS